LPAGAAVLRIFAVRGPDELLVDAAARQLPVLLAEAETYVWVDLVSPTTAEEQAVLSDVFHFHPLAIEDCIGARMHPKIDEFDGYLYIITHGLKTASTAEAIQPDELDAFLGPRYLVTHHAEDSRSVAQVIDGLPKAGLPLRRGPVAVLHAILDRQVDGLEAVIDDVELRIEALEDAVFERHANTSIVTLLSVKRSILQLRRWMSKQRLVLLRLGRGEFPEIQPNDALLFRDVYDHVVRINDLLENFREMLTSIQEAHLAVTSNRLNEVMKFLAVCTVLLGPATLIAGIYGMNFQHMPELSWRWGYPLALGLMVCVEAAGLLFFWRRGWLGGARS
jgi:magnesium transporter